MQATCRGDAGHEFEPLCWKKTLTVEQIVQSVSFTQKHIFRFVHSISYCLNCTKWFLLKFLFSPSKMEASRIHVLFFFFLSKLHSEYQYAVFLLSSGEMIQFILVAVSLLQMRQTVISERSHWAYPKDQFTNCSDIHTLLSTGYKFYEQPGFIVIFSFVFRIIQL